MANICYYFPISITITAFIPSSLCFRLVPLLVILGECHLPEVEALEALAGADREHLTLE